MIPKEAIEKAIEGRWLPIPEWIEIKYWSDGIELLVYRFVGGYESKNFLWSEIALDASFWQCFVRGINQSDDFEGFKRDWYAKACRFYDLILTGGDTEAFWAEFLTPSQTRPHPHT